MSENYPGKFVWQKDAFAICDTLPNNTNAFYGLSNLQLAENQTIKPRFKHMYNESAAPLSQTNTPLLTSMLKFKVGNVIGYNNPQISPKKYRIDRINFEAFYYDVTVFDGKYSYASRIYFEDQDSLALVSSGKHSSASPTNPSMDLAHLSAHENWIIALDKSTNKLVAFDEGNQCIKAVGSLLCAAGRAWMWDGTKLWSGPLSEVETEGEKIARPKRELEKKRSIIYDQARVKSTKANEKYEKERVKILAEREKALEALATQSL